MSASRLTGLLIMVTALLTSACQQRCQQPPERPFRFLGETPWRLVETTDPSNAKNLTNTNFLIFQFAQNGTGDIKRVKDNDQYDTPLFTIQWNVDLAQQLVRIKYTTGVATTDFIDPDATPTGGEDAGTFDYTYDVGRELEMYEVKRGFYYRFVPFTGVVYPDQDCTF